MPTATWGFPDEGALLDTCDKLVDFNAWDATKIDYRGWLDNFDAQDRGYAAFLLSRFTFLNDHLVDQLFRAAFHNLSNGLTPHWEPFATAQRRWRAFYDAAIVTIVQGEQPNPSDSGWLFARKARQFVGISEKNLLEPVQAVERVRDGFDGPLIFVDDFVGSGEQFLKTWQRMYSPPTGAPVSFRSLEQSGAKASFFYCSTMATEYGCDRLKRGAPAVRITTGNTVPKGDTLGPDSPQWPPHIKDNAVRMIQRISGQLGYTTTDGGESDWRGFHKLGLGIAFAHSVPDANLPIFFGEKPGWKPLVRRS